MRGSRLRLRNVVLLLGLWTLGVGVAWAAAQSPSFQQYGTGGTVQPPPTTQAVTTAGGTTTGGTTTGETGTTTTEATPAGLPPTDTQGTPLGEATEVSQPLAAVEAVGDVLPFTGSQAGVAFLVIGTALAVAGLGLRRFGRQRSE